MRGNKMRTSDGPGLRIMVRKPDTPDLLAAPMVATIPKEIVPEGALSNFIKPFDNNDASAASHDPEKLQISLPGSCAKPETGMRPCGVPMLPLWGVVSP